MNYKNLLLILFFLTSCTVQSTQYSENIFSNKGFVLLYDESLIEKKLLRKPLDDRSLEIVHNTLSKGTKVRIINLLNNKSINAVVKTKNKNLFFYNSIFSKRIFDELDISLKEPYVEISKIRENKTFIAKKSKTFDEEKKVANKAPVKSISINEIGTPKSKELDDRRSFNYSIKITEFYFLKNANELKERIKNETSLKNINIISINDTKHQVLLGPYSNINTLQSAYNSINNLNFENIELIKND
ncbi:septal ring lytic transglycosylase RlpA family protein [Candidatus Pelagibacter sp.]|nr:septal ring lytic transglycosylase RlpA family protein [Candidatus Pelagibacter sp.]